MGRRVCLDGLWSWLFIDRLKERFLVGISARVGIMLGLGLQFNLGIKYRQGLSNMVLTTNHPPTNTHSLI